MGNIHTLHSVICDACKVDSRSSRQTRRVRAGGGGVVCPQAPDLGVVVAPLHPRDHHWSQHL